MAHDVFISYSSKDKPTADAVCASLEAKGIRCWIAPRDILPSMDWGEAIINAINHSRLMILIFSSNANGSIQIKREVERAASKEVPILPFRIENVDPSGALEYYLGTPHWLDALTPPLENHINQLVESVQLLLSMLPEKKVSNFENSSSVNVEKNKGETTEVINELYKTNLFSTAEKPADVTKINQKFNDTGGFAYKVGKRAYFIGSKFLSLLFSIQLFFKNTDFIGNDSQNKKEKNLKVPLILIFIGIGGFILWLGLGSFIIFLISSITLITGVMMLLIKLLRKWAKNHYN